jgi:hypothetical protein
MITAINRLKGKEEGDENLRFRGKGSTDGKGYHSVYSVHTELGPGFNERIYSNALKVGLLKLGVAFDSEKQFPVRFQQQPIGKLRLIFW